MELCDDAYCNNSGIPASIRGRISWISAGILRWRRVRPNRYRFNCVVLTDVVWRAALRVVQLLKRGICPLRAAIRSALTRPVFSGTFRSFGFGRIAPGAVFRCRVRSDQSEISSMSRRQGSGRLPGDPIVAEGPVWCLSCLRGGRLGRSSAHLRSGVALPLLVERSGINHQCSGRPLMCGSAGHISVIDDTSCPENAIFLPWQITQTMRQRALGWAERFTVHPHTARGMAGPLPQMMHVAAHPASKLRPWWTPGLTTTNGLRVSLAIGGNVEVVGFAAPDFVSLVTPLI